MERTRADEQKIAFAKRVPLVVYLVPVDPSGGKNDLKRGVPVPRVCLEIRVVVQHDIRIIFILDFLVDSFQMLDHLDLPFCENV